MKDCMTSRGNAVKDHDRRGHADVGVRIPSRQQETRTLTALTRTRGQERGQERGHADKNADKNAVMRTGMRIIQGATQPPSPHPANQRAGEPDSTAGRAGHPPSQPASKSASHPACQPSSKRASQAAIHPASQPVKQPRLA